jgi:hypothetical protein|tara:strand:+ start:4741 stop:5157 length:417 start_codon:yes stop_codon:yes gene_type:complete
MAREYLRPFTKAVNIDDTDTHIIELTDTMGNLFSCNYITVEAVSGAGTSFFAAVPSGIDVSGSADAYKASTMLGVASGVNGLASNNNGGSIVLGLAPYDSVQAVVLSQASADTVNYLISYGNVTLSNQVADSQASRGG